MTFCRWTSSTTPRVVPGRHADELGDDPIHAETCSGCLPCWERHCVQCGHRHVQQLTCPACIGATRADLIDIAALYDRLDDEATHHPNADIPGGTAAVLTGPWSAGKAAAWADECGEDSTHRWDEHGTPTHPFDVLVTWQDAWSDALGIPLPTRRATVPSSVDWHIRHLHDVAQHEAWPQFATEVRALRTQLEAVLLDGERDVIAEVACLECGARLRQTYDPPKPGATDQGGRRDHWTCPRCRCRVTDASYRLAVAQAAIDAQPIRPGVLIARDLGIPHARVRQWITRGQVQRQGTDQRGRVLLDVREVRRQVVA